MFQPKFQKAIKIICQCRQTLIYTYVFAYYLTRSNSALIFEQNQADLESVTEKLSEYLETELTDDNINKLQQHVLDTSM